MRPELAVSSGAGVNGRGQALNAACGGRAQICLLGCQVQLSKGVACRIIDKNTICMFVNEIYNL